MNTRRIGVVLGAVLVVAVGLVGLAVWMGWTAAPLLTEPVATPVIEPDSQNPSAERAPVMATPEVELVEPDGAFDAFEDDSVAAGHHDVAEALGRKMIRCFTGRVFDTGSLGGRYLHEIRGGWYTAVPYEASGVRIVTRPLDPPTSLLGPREDLGVVRWTTTNDSDSVIKCTWEPVQYGRIHVRVFDEDGKAVDGADVRVGNAKAKTHQGLARLQRIPTHAPVTLYTSYKTDSGICMAKVVVDPVVSDAVTTLEQTPECVPWRDSQALMDEVLEDGPTGGLEAAVALRAREHEALTDFAASHPRQGEAALKVEAVRRALRPRRRRGMSTEEVLDLAVEEGLLGDDEADEAEEILLQE